MHNFKQDFLLNLLMFSIIFLIIFVLAGSFIIFCYGVMLLVTGGYWIWILVAICIISLVALLITIKDHHCRGA